jgi:hypothetical protein
MQPNRFFRVNKINFYLSLCTIANLPFVANNAVAAEASDNTSKIETISIMSQRNLLGNEGLVNQALPNKTIPK